MSFTVFPNKPRRQKLDPHAQANALGHFHYILCRVYLPSPQFEVPEWYLKSANSYHEMLTKGRPLWYISGCSVLAEREQQGHQQRPAGAQDIRGILRRKDPKNPNRSMYQCCVVSGRCVAGRGCLLPMGLSGSRVLPLPPPTGARIEGHESPCIKASKGKYGLKWVRLSYRNLVDNHVRLQLLALDSADVHVFCSFYPPILRVSSSLGISRRTETTFAYGEIGVRGPVLLFLGRRTYDGDD